MGTNTLTPAQVSKELGVSKDNVYQWIADGELVARNTAKKKNAKTPRWKILRDDLNKFLRKRASAFVPPLETEKRRRTKPRKNYLK